MEYNKQFLIIGNQNAFTYKGIFPLIKDNKILVGYTKPKEFFIPAENGEGVVLSKKVGGITIWFTNIPNKKGNEPMVLTATYAEGLNHREDYPKYDNYDAIEVSKCKNIPYDYDGIMGVPITFLSDYCPEQFEILGDSRFHDGSDVSNDINYVNGKLKYRRILIRRTTNEKQIH